MTYIKGNKNNQQIEDISKDKCYKKYYCDKQKVKDITR